MSTPLVKGAAVQHLLGAFSRYTNILLEKRELPGERIRRLNLSQKDKNIEETILMTIKFYSIKNMNIAYNMRKVHLRDFTD